MDFQTLEAKFKIYIICQKKKKKKKKNTPNLHS